MKIIARRDALLLVLAVHLGVDVLLTSSAPLIYLRRGGLLSLGIAFALLALPIAQGCLIAIWAATSRMRFYLRLPVALAGTMVPVIVLLGSEEIGISESIAPKYAAAMLTQLLTVLLVVNGIRFARRQFRLSRAGWTEADARSTHFTIAQLLLWTAVLATMLGVGKAVCGLLGWTAASLADESSQVFQVYAAHNGLYGLMVLGLFTVRVRWPVRILLFTLVVTASGAVAWLTSLAMTMCLPGTGLASFPRLLMLVLMLAVPQIIYHTITLWPLWLCGYIGQRGHADTGPHETTPAADNPFAQ